MLNGDNQTVATNQTKPSQAKPNWNELNWGDKQQQQQKNFEIKKKKKNNESREADSLVEMQWRPSV